MAKIKVGIAGCLGRMGQELIKQILNDKNFIFVGGFEHKSHPKIGKKMSDVTDINSSSLSLSVVSNTKNINTSINNSKVSLILTQLN